MVGVVAENAERCGTEHEMRPFEDWQSNPSRSQDAPELAVREKRYISVHRPKAGNEPVGAVGNLRGYFTLRATIPEDIPIRSFFTNVHSAPSFVITVVPFG
jgi:hypothetical protein